MSLYYASLNSGSNGNCYYVGNALHAVFIDAGLHRKETVKRMERLGLDMQKLRAIFISHEHIDHVRGLSGLARRYNLPVYISKGTHTRMRNELNLVTVHVINDEEPVVVEDILIYPFKKVHDAASPFSFVIEYNEKRVGVFTDLGYACNALKKYFACCHAAFLEANYDNEMLHSGPYPARLKQRISGGRGHLSNHQALQLFLENANENLQHVLLSHLSAENNDPDLVLQLFASHANGKKITVASRFNESEIFYLNENLPAITPPLENAGLQMKLF
jgi:phosphoribosyl 1,2-cyclic phosphodiesterase